MDSKTFFRKLDSIQDIPTLPVVAFKVNQMLQDYDISINELSQAIEKDQAIVFKLLKLVNSSFFGFQSQIDTIHRAIVVLGFSAVRNAILSISVINAFSEKEGFKGFDIRDFWKHSVAVSVTSKCISEQTRLESPDECFLAGLLHDIGKVVLAQYFKGLLGQVLASVKDHGLSFYEAEKALLPTNHAQVGGHLAKKWQLPVYLNEAITYHHAVRKTVQNPNLLMVVHVADIFVNNLKADSESTPDFSAIHPDAAKIMGTELKTVSDWFPKVAAEIESAYEFFLEEV